MLDRSGPAGPFQDGDALNQRGLIYYFLQFFFGFLSSHRIRPRFCRFVKAASLFTIHISWKTTKM
ncbi:hypothetical protein HBI56_020720 [Parastagonospora nodorum]|uniref:Uncharacterized protein n=1 Tax=Phaeosphaeria nodorum (strain SN15 / ATCC MYA-4574 / FGSC 10173) TaxID=321614 RepID=A0A7U2HZH8_PHANO|nr:hypothetical protein HBH56_173690 [Parastagonospora nodorum]QRC96403.1 hypothetical protein JI435_408930 [Parastagonospora nodorum SN15]KAH4007886.1 hypothetical protein HBI10_007710 [Parastagonospora nodorum]KAH4023517.1 hypothetical protein HBI13_089420 [Parastagonospora nodorum]KAH4041220.1 hypothetical protein HBI09_019690 [Parastagonospora nodorum]